MTRSRTDLVVFAVLTVLLSWGLLLAAGLAGPSVKSGSAQLLFALGTSGPTLVALALWLAGRRRRLEPGAARRVLAATPRWLPVAVLAGVLPAVVATAAQCLLPGGMDFAAPGRVVADAGGPAVLLVGLLLGGPLAEEFGWRGYAQPRLRARWSPSSTALGLGAAWAVWHLPLFFLVGTTQHDLVLAQAVLFLVTFLPWSYLAWFVSEHLGGGVAAAVLLHLCVNGAQALLRPQSLLAGLVLTVVMVGLAVGCRSVVATRPALERVRA